MKEIIATLIGIVVLWFWSGRYKTMKVESENQKLKQELATEKVKVKEDEIASDMKVLSDIQEPRKPQVTLHHKVEYVNRATRIAQNESVSEEPRTTPIEETPTNELPEYIRQLAERQARRHMK